ncbi:MAG: hypothetical protein IJ730_00785 [Alphaproteobacteria bacterium]|nr:hypothetical protein [Alphaproteobacteria bacterium]
MKKIAFLGALLCSASFVSAEDAAVNESGESKVGQHGFYYGIGVLACNSGERVDYYGPEGKRVEVNEFGTRMGGSVVLGYQFMPVNQPLCIGVELGSDFSPRHEAIENGSDIRAAYQDMYETKVTRNGFRPFFALRGGYVNYDHKFMTYLKVGMSYAYSKEYYNMVRVRGGVETPTSSIQKLSCWTPIIALGIEKTFTKDFTFRGEFEYKFTRTKDHGFSRGDSLKLIQKGSFNVRALFCQNIKLNF